MSNANKFPAELNVPQRQSPIGVLIEILLVLQKTIKSLWPIFLILLIRIRDFDWRYSVLILTVILISVAVAGYLNFRNFLFYVDDEKEEFILNRGVINKKRVVIQFARIQQVNINQSYFQKLAGVYAVQIETAGSAKSEATINAISQALALQLRTKLLTAPFQSPINNETEIISPGEVLTQPLPLIKISLGTLVKTGITSDYLKSLSLLIAFGSAVYSNIKDIWLNDEDNETQFYNYVSSLNLTQYLLVLFSAIVLLIFVVNLVRMVVLYYDFKISLHGKSLLLSYGLFNTRNTIIKPSKVQVISVVSNYFQKRLNLSRVMVQQASSDFAMDKKATLQIPGCNAKEKEAILQLILGSLPEKGAMLKPNIRKVFGAVIRVILIPVLLFMAFSFLYPSLHDYLYLVPLYLVLMIIMIFFSYQNNRLFVKDDIIILQSGIWDISNEYLQPWKIQSITTRQNLWHVKANIGHVILHTAGGDMDFRFADFSRIQKYVNEWLYYVESSEKEWM